MEILVLLMIFVLFGVIGIVFVKIFPERVNKKQAQCSQAVTAKIVDVKTYQSSDSGFSYAAVCEFSLNGMLYRKTSEIYTGKQPAVGIKVKLFVNPYNIDMFVNPETNDYLKRKYKIVGKIVLGVDALVFIITIIAVIVRLA